MAARYSTSWVVLVELVATGMAYGYSIVPGVELESLLLVVLLAFSGDLSLQSLPFDP